MLDGALRPGSWRHRDCDAERAADRACGANAETALRGDSPKRRGALRLGRGACQIEGNGTPGDVGVPGGRPPFSPSPVRRRDARGGAGGVRSAAVSASRGLRPRVSGPFCIAVPMPPRSQSRCAIERNAETAAEATRQRRTRNGGKSDRGRVTPTRSDRAAAPRVRLVREDSDPNPPS
jgi:hypothetical protein